MSTSIQPSTGGHDTIELLDAQRRILELLLERSEQEEVLNGLCEILEEVVPGTSVAISLHDRVTHTVRIAAAASLPDSVRIALERVAVAPTGTSSSAAVHYGKTVVVEDISDNSIWLDMRRTVEHQGLHSCWSLPLHRSVANPGSERRVVGTADFFFRKTQPFDNDLLALLESASGLAGRVLENTQSRQSLYQRQSYDALTDLPNRSLFTQRLRKLIDEIRTSGDRSEDRRFAIAVLDLDNFKEVNNTVGFQVGDLLLQAVGQRLSALLGESDTIARSGGDDFLLLIQELEEDIADTAQTVLRKVNEPYDFDGHPLFTTATLGISVYPWDGEDPQTLLRSAETALQAAKERGGSSYELFRPTMTRNQPTAERWFQQTRLSSQLRNVLNTDELELHYQLKVGSDRETFVGAEALIRWRHPELGLLVPGQFLPLAERMGLTVPFGDWGLHKTCRQIRLWQQAGLPDVPVSVNVSPLQFRHGRFLQTLEEALRTTQLDPRMLELEIVERLAMEDTVNNQRRLRRLHDLGIRLSIDDFGTGFSSLSYLGRFPFDTIKIDRSFVKDIGTRSDRDRDNRNIVLAIISMARALKIDVVAEGVETEEQADFLFDNGCDVIQGFLFARPVPPDDVADRLAGQAAKRLA